MFKPNNSRKGSLIQNEEGIVAVFILLAMPVIIAVLGICLDIGVVLFHDAELSAAVKFSAISATSSYIIEDNNIEITADREFVDRALQKNMNGALLVDFNVNRNQCTVEATYYVPFTFMKIFGLEGKTLMESFTAERNVQ